MPSLHIAIRTLLNTYGEEFCTDRQFVDYLSDCAAFNLPALKTIMHAIVDDGYASELLDVVRTSQDWRFHINESSARIVRHYGFQVSYVNYCLQSLCYGLGLIDDVDASFLSNNINSHDSSTFSPVSADNEQTQWQGSQPTPNNSKKPAFVPYKAVTTKRNKAYKYGTYSRNDSGGLLDAIRRYYLVIIVTGCCCIVLMVLLNALNRKKRENTQDNFDTSESKYPIINPPSPPSYNYDDYDSLYDTGKYDYTDDDFQQELDSIPAPPPPTSLTPPPPVIGNEHSGDITDGPPPPPGIDKPAKESLRSKAGRYYRKAKKKVLETMGMDEEEAKEKWEEVKGNAKEKWNEAKEKAKETWDDNKDDLKEKWDDFKDLFR